jgi:hypothetical protein
MNAARRRSVPSVAFAIFYTIVLAIGVTLGIRTMVDGYSPIPSIDLWAFFDFIERGLDRDVGLSDLWAQWNEHRFLLARLHFLADYGIFEGRNVYLYAWIAASCLLLAATFAVAVWFDTCDSVLTLGALAVAGTAALPLAGVENLTSAVQVQFVQVFLWATVSILAIVLAARSPVPRRQALGCGVSALAALVATYSLANGLTTWVIVVVLAALLRMDGRWTVGLVIAALVTGASYLWHYESSDRTLSDPGGLVHYVVTYLGGAPTPGGGSAALVGAAGLVLLGVLFALFFANRLGGSLLVPFGVGVATFIVLTAAQTATGRLELGVSQALASRYSIASYTFWLALFVGFLPVVRARLGAWSLAAPAYLAGAAVVALVAGYAALPQSSQLRSQIAGRHVTLASYRAGVEDITLSLPHVEGSPAITRALRFLEREKLGPFAPGGPATTMRVGKPRTTTDHACFGEVEDVTAIGGDSRLVGWIAARGGEASSPYLAVLDAEGRLAGVGYVGTHRPDVAQSGAAGSEWLGFVAYVRGRPTTPLDVVLLDEDGVEALCRLRQPAVG